MNAPAHVSQMAFAPFLERWQAKVHETPARVALLDDHRMLNAVELLDEVRRVAGVLAGHGVEAGSRVGLHQERDVDTIVCLLAILWCGAAYVPLDRRLPEERLAFMVQDAGVRLVISDDPRPAAWGGDATVLAKGALLASAMGPDAGRADRTLTEGHELAYVIYTSGSTGVPKGVQITQANLAWLLDAWDTVMGAEGHVSMLLSPLSFDASVVELFWPLAAGQMLVVTPESTGSNALADSVGAQIVRHGVTHLQCTPTRAALMLADPDDRRSLAQIRHLVVGGEPVPVSLAREVVDAGVRRITCAYGPTEATVWATTHEVCAAELDSSTECATVPIGRPLPGCTTIVTDGDGRTVGEGVVGELVLVGPMVSPGYLQRPELTASRFFEWTDGSTSLRAYRTGDLAALRPGGVLEFHGRSDHQVKIRGHRVELGDIESNLLMDHRVSQAVVMVHPNRPHELVAVLVASAGHHALRDELHDVSVRLRERVSDVMVPAGFEVVDSLPMTNSGKVDRLAVADRLRNGEGASVAATVPVDGYGNDDDSVEAMVADYRAVLNRWSVGPDDDFFDLGGHSMNAVELMARIEDRTGMRLPLRSLLSTPTPRLLTERVSLQRQRPVNDGPLVRFTERSDDASRRTLYLVHGGGGHVLRFRDLALALADEFDVVAIQAAGLDGNEAPDMTLRDIVDRYAAAIRSDDPVGPYELGGYSLGGLIALHLAERFEADGAKVRSLVLIDPIDSDVLADGWIQRGISVMWGITHREGRSVGRWLRDSVEGLRLRSTWDRAGLEVTRRIGYRDIYDHVVRVVGDGPRAGSVDAPGLLIKSSVENPLRIRRWDQGERAPRHTEVVWVSAKHDVLLVPSTVPPIASALRRFLSNV